MDFQKELSKREHYEKPSVKRKRMKEQAIKKTKKDVDTKQAHGAQFFSTTNKFGKIIFNQWKT